MRESVRALIVDDEPHGRRGVRVRLERTAGVEVVGECRNGREAIASIEALAPNLVFLDVQMPGVDGFGVVEAVGPERMPVTVFVTAHDHHALRAFEAQALDYLLKPIDDDRFEAAVARAVGRVRADSRGGLVDRLQALVSREPPERQRPQRFAVRTGGRIAFVDAAEVDVAEAAGDYVTLRTRRGAHLLRATMVEVERALGSEFVRVHRSTIVRASRVRELLPYGSSAYLAVLDDGTRLKVSRGYREAVLGYFDVGT